MIRTYLETEIRTRHLRFKVIFFGFATGAAVPAVTVTVAVTTPAADPTALWVRQTVNFAGIAFSCWSLTYHDDLCELMKTF